MKTNLHTQVRTLLTNRFQNEPWFHSLGVGSKGFIIYTNREIPKRDQQPVNQDGYKVEWVNLGKVKPHSNPAPP